MWQTSTAPTNISSGVHWPASPRNSGGLDIFIVGLPSDERSPDFPSVQDVLVLYVNDLYFAFVVSAAVNSPSGICYE